MAANTAQRQELIKLFQRYNQRLGILYGRFVKELSKLGISVEDKLQDEPLFMFDHFPELQTRLADIVKDYKNDYVSLYKDGITSGVALAFAQDAKNLHGYTIYNDDAINRVRTATINSYIRQRQQSPVGLSLSQRIWNYVEQTKSEFEVGITNVITDGLKKGTSAAELSQLVRKQLSQPDMMYRRYHHKVITAGGAKKDVVKWHKKVVEEDGKVHFVEAPLEQVGSGVYRSSYKNSFRLMRSEINMSYHYANNERWMSEPFVIGIRIWLSPEHPRYDMCDELAGNYPKDFMFGGWHPQCLCASSAILCDMDEQRDIEKRIIRGEDMSKYVSPNAIKDVPDNFKQYIDNQHDKILASAERGTLGYFLRDNKKYWAGRFSAEERAQMGIRELSPTRTAKDVARMRHAKRTDAQVADILNRWDKRNIKNIEAITSKFYELTDRIPYNEHLRIAKKAIKANKPREEYIEYLRAAEKWAATINKANIRHAARTAEQVADIQKRWDARQYNNIPLLLRQKYTTAQQVNETFAEINSRLKEKWFEHGNLRLSTNVMPNENGNTDMKGVINLTTERVNHVMSALSKIGQGKSAEISFVEADAMATLWHEITHNRNIKGLMYMTYAERRYMELANEFVARHSLTEFYQVLGVKKMPCPELAYHRISTGYNGMVTSYDHIIDILNLNRDKCYSAVRKHLFNEAYDVQIKGLKQGLIKGGIRYSANNKKVSNAHLNQLIEYIRTNSGPDVNANYRRIEQWLKDHGITGS